MTGGVTGAASPCLGIACQGAVDVIPIAPLVQQDDLAAYRTDFLGHLEHACLTAPHASLPSSLADSQAHSTAAAVGSLHEHSQQPIQVSHCSQIQSSSSSQFVQMYSSQYGMAILDSLWREAVPTEHQRHYRPDTGRASNHRATAPCGTPYKRA